MLQKIIGYAHELGSRFGVSGADRFLGEIGAGGD
jgi:hypothetical protein